MQIEKLAANKADVDTLPLFCVHSWGVMNLTF